MFRRNHERMWTSFDISIMDCIQVSCVEVGRLQINRTLSSFSFVFRLTCKPRTGTKPSCGQKHMFNHVQLRWLIVFNLHFVILSPLKEHTNHSRIQSFPLDTCKGLPETNPNQTFSMEEKLILCCISKGLVASRTETVKSDLAGSLW